MSAAVANRAPGRTSASVLRLVALSLIGWSLLAAIPTTSAYLGSGAPGWPVWWAMFRKIGLYYYMWGALAPLLYWLTGRLPLRGARLALTLAAHGVTLVVLSFGLGFIAHYGDWQEWLLGRRAWGYHAMSAFTYALIVLCCLALRFYRLSVLRERELADARLTSAALENSLNLARVDSLRMQLNPHFLFNALNSVGALIETERGEAAYEAVEKLAELLRRALRLSQQSETSLGEELRFSAAYLALEQLRFDERLRVEWDIEAGTRQYQVPAFVLQPLIENTIRHAVGPSASPITVTIAATRDGDMLRLGVSDDGAGSAPNTAGAGVGLSNLRERLQLLFGEAAGLEAATRTDGYAARVTIPLRRGATADA